MLPGAVRSKIAPFDDGESDQIEKSSAFGQSRWRERDRKSAQGRELAIDPECYSSFSCSAYCGASTCLRAPSHSLELSSCCFPWLSRMLSSRPALPPWAHRSEDAPHRRHCRPGRMKFEGIQERDRGLGSGLID